MTPADAAGATFASSLTKQAPTFGTWWLWYTDAAGQRVRERSGARLQEGAERLAQEKELKAERVRAGLEQGAPTPMTCAQLFEKYLEANAHLSSQASMKSQGEDLVRVALRPGARGNRHPC